MAWVRPGPALVRVVLPLALAAYGGLLPAEEPADAAAPPQQLPTIPVDDPSESAKPSPPAEQLPLIVVTGSHIPRPDFESASPIFVMTREDIERTGHTNFGELLQEMVIAGPAMNRTWNAYGSGQTEINLRNMGTQRTLVLVDGQRWIHGMDVRNSGSFDLNTLPLALIDRVEVLKDGASAIYGSDAIAGVINVITRKYWTGTELRGQWQAYQDGENFVQSYNFVTGRVTSSVSTLVEFDYLKQQGAPGASRSVRRPGVLGSPLARAGSIYDAPPRLLFLAEDQVAEQLNTADPANCSDQLSPLPINSGAIIPGCDIVLKPGATLQPGEPLATAAAKFAPYAGQLYDFIPYHYLLTPFESQSLFGQVHARLGSAIWGTRLHYLRNSSLNIDAGASLAFGWTPWNRDVYVDRTALWNPFGQDLGKYYGQDTDGDLGLNVGTAQVMRRFVELGPQQWTRAMDLLHVRTGLEGNFAHADQIVFYEIGGSYNRSAQHEVYSGGVNKDHLKLALGPRINCDPAAGCVALNPFGAPGSITADMADYIRATPVHDSVELVAPGVVGHMSTDWQWGLLEAPVGLAWGAEYREEDLEQRIDPRRSNNQLLLEAPPYLKATSGGFEVAETFLEARLPLLRDRPLARMLELTLAGRYTDYSFLRGHVAPKAGIRYQPVEELLLRATWSRAFRGPTISELYLGGAEYIGYPFVVDPCDGDSPDNVAKHCMDEGGTALGWANPATPTSGNPDLRAETGSSVTAGLVFSPAFVPGFTAYVDYFDFDMRDFIKIPIPQYVIDRCYLRAADAPRPPECDHVHRERNGLISQVDLMPYNLAAMRVNGFDTSFEWMLPWMPELFGYPGVLRWQFVSQYLAQFDETTLVDQAPDHLAGVSLGDNVYPRFKFNNGVTWTGDPWSVQWNVRYLSGVTERCSVGTTVTTVGFEGGPKFKCAVTPTNRLASVVYHDIQLGHAMNADAHLTAGIWNVLNRDPPGSDFAYRDGYAGSVYRPPGSRTPYLRVSVGF